MRNKFLIFILLIAFFLRLFNLGKTARFTRDEASDLARMHQYWQEKKITLVGPISSDNKKVFSALTYYMLMPFAVLGNFNPLSVVYGTVFWGILTLIVMVLITNKLNQQSLWLSTLLITIWYPLLITSRWAWNPHYVIFWIALGLLTYLYKNNWSLALSGLFLSLSIHNHYISLISTGLFVLLSILSLLKNRQFKLSILQFGGYILGLVPFLIFDLRHPPGLFLGKYLRFVNTPNIETNFTASWLTKLSTSYLHSLQALGINVLWLAVIIGVLMLVVLFKDIKDKNKLPIFLSLTVISQFLIGLFLKEYWPRYFYPAVPFVFVWLVIKRKGISFLITKLLIIIFIIISLIQLPTVLFETQVPPSINNFNAVVNKVIEISKEQNTNRPNLAVLSSPDRDPLGEAYRHVLAIKGIDLKLPTEYSTSSQAFIISTSDLDKLKQDQSSIMGRFRQAQKIKKYPIENSKWQVYWFEM